MPDSANSVAFPLAPRKGDLTRAAIVEAALLAASRGGLEGLTIGTLADSMQMSKSGVFAHFGSREELQLAVLKAYVQRFIDEVLRPAVKKPRGLPRLEAILQRWVAFLAREMTRGCIMIAGAVEYDDVPGPQRDEMVAIITGWKRELIKAIRQAVSEGHLKPRVDAHQLVFEIYGLMLAMHQDARLLRSADSAKRARAGLRRLLDNIRVLPLNSKRTPGRPKPASLTQPPRVHVRREASRTRATKE
jgi:AcrR family transcriptional regulator